MGLSSIERIIPGARWLRGYSTEFFAADLIAGITVGLTVLPQSLAYATLAGLDPQYGLYSSFIGGAVYALLGGCRYVNISGNPRLKDFFVEKQNINFYCLQRSYDRTNCLISIDD